MSTSFLKRVSVAAAGLALLMSANAQSADREAGWEAGFDVVYQFSKDIDFEGGSQLALDDDVGVSFTFGYRINPHLELQFALDWSDLDYWATLVTENGAILTGGGEMEYFTPRANLQWNLYSGSFTPFVMGGVGYSFIDTDIPTGRPQTGCWWDPWYGYMCTTVQPTKTTEEFTYQAGLGIRMDVSSSLSLRLALERHWIDLSYGDSAPYVDQVKLGISFR